MDSFVPERGSPVAFARVNVADKRVINGQADVNQLVPFLKRETNFFERKNTSYQQSFGLDWEA
jgi:hypothetical protein